MKYLIIITMLLLNSCRIYERDYVENIPVPIIKNDTIDISNWE